MLVRFEVALSALHEGLSVKRNRWEASTKLVVSDGELMQSNPNWKMPSPIQLDWDDIAANDWIILPEAA